MGIDRPAAEFLAAACRNGVDFTRTLTLGRQSRFGPPAALADALVRGGAIEDPEPVETALRRAGGWADPVLTALGAATVEALDLSDFEGATVRHDLNVPLPDELDGRWTAVIDGGATEHVFRFDTALESSMRLVAPGGHLVAIVPTNQQAGHGFYQIGPEVYLGALVPDNGFELCGMWVHEATPNGRWSVAPSAADGRRHTFGSAAPAMLYVVGRRVGDAGLHRTPQQSDYAAAWDDGGPPVTAVADKAAGRRAAVYRRLGPRIGDRLQHLRWLSAVARAGQLERVDIDRLRF